MTKQSFCENTIAYLKDAIHSSILERCHLWIGGVIVIVLVYRRARQKVWPSEQDLLSLSVFGAGIYGGGMLVGQAAALKADAPGATSWVLFFVGIATVIGSIRGARNVIMGSVQPRSAEPIEQRDSDVRDKQHKG
jgi:hypothetical protein